MQTDEAVSQASLYFIVSRTGRIVNPLVAGQASGSESENVAGGAAAVRVGEDQCTSNEQSGDFKVLLGKRRCQLDIAECSSKRMAWNFVRKNSQLSAAGYEEEPSRMGSGQLWKISRSRRRRSESTLRVFNGRSVPEDLMNNEPGQSGSLGSQAVSVPERGYRLEEQVKKALAQLSVLHRWEEGTRLRSSKWVSWLLRLLRKARPCPRALQRLLFSVCAAVLPLVCYSLVRQTWLQSQDAELLRSVDILWRALQKSHNCFSSSQWKILGERISECHRLRLKVGSWVARYWQPYSLSKINSTNLPPAHHAQLIVQSEASKCPELDVDPEHSSNERVLSEGVLDMVKRALREKTSTYAKHYANCINSKLPDGKGAIVTLICPLSRSRIKVPARGVDCLHPNCFDLQTYLEVHAKMACLSQQNLYTQQGTYYQTTWRCPICGADATWPQIVVDALMLRMLKDLPEHVVNAQMQLDGTWQAVCPADNKDENINSVDNQGETLQDTISFLGHVTGGCHGIGIPMEQIDEICRVARDITWGSSLDACESSCVRVDSSGTVIAEMADCSTLGVGRDFDTPSNCLKTDNEIPSVAVEGTGSVMEKEIGGISSRNLRLVSKEILNMTSREHYVENCCVEAVVPEEEDMTQRICPLSQICAPFQQVGEGTKDYPKVVENLNAMQGLSLKQFRCTGDTELFKLHSGGPKARRKRKAMKV